MSDKTMVYIGRFQPFHNGHARTIDMAFQEASSLIIVVGSANAPRTINNPFTYEERVDMIKDYLSTLPFSIRNITFIPVADSLYSNNKWLTTVQERVESSAKNEISLIGYEKDSSSFYLKNLFNWGFFDTGPHIKESGNNGKPVSATKIRELLFEDHLGYTASNVPETTYKFLEVFRETEDYQNLKEWYDHTIAEEKIYETLPYGVNFITVDSLVVQSGHVLLVKRSDHPGKGLWALPGVHLDQNETLQEGSIRALIKETNLKVPEKVLRGSLKDSQDFDHPNRSTRCRISSKRARTLTKAFYYELNSEHPLPKQVKAGEGAEEAWWFTFSEVKRMRDRMFEDHADIIEYFLKF